MEMSDRTWQHQKYAMPETFQVILVLEINSKWERGY